MKSETEIYNLRAKSQICPPKFKDFSLKLNDFIWTQESCIKVAINKSNNDTKILLKYFILLSGAGIVYLLSF